MKRGFAPGTGKGAVPEAPRFACAPATLILARATPILAEGQGFRGLNPNRKGCSKRTVLVGI